MPHLKCAACRARVWRDGDAESHARDLCPGCGDPLEPVVRAEELIGLRALRTRPSTHASIADHVRDTIARNDAARVLRLRSAQAVTRQPDPE
jgi:hypothetical protein